MFSIVAHTHEQLVCLGFPVEGVSYSNETEALRIDFVGVVTDAQCQEAYSIAKDIMAQEEILRLQYEKEQEKVIRPEKIQPLVDLLISKGILTAEDISQI